MNRGALCARGQAACRGSTIRIDIAVQGSTEGRLEPIGWDQALQLFAQKIGETRSAAVRQRGLHQPARIGSFPGFLDAWLPVSGCLRTSVTTQVRITRDCRKKQSTACLAELDSARRGSCVDRS